MNFSIIELKSSIDANSAWHNFSTFPIPQTAFAFDSNAVST